jgi:hypothetical protein
MAKAKMPAMKIFKITDTPSLINAVEIREDSHSIG